MAFAPARIILTRVQRQILVDLDRMAMALNSDDSVPFALARFVASRHGTIHAHRVLIGLCQNGFLRPNHRDECYILTDKPVPPERECPRTSVPVATLDVSFFEQVAAKWISGDRAVETYLVRDDDPESTRSSVSEQSIERTLTKARIAVNGSTSAATPWGTIMADHLLLEELNGGGLIGPQSVRLIAMHYPHLGAPQSKQTAMRAEGVLDTTRKAGLKGGLWSVSDLAAHVIARLRIQPSLTPDQARAFLDS